MTQSRQGGGPAPSSVRHTGVIAAVVVIVIAVALAAALEVPVSPVSCTTQGTALVVRTTSVASTVTFTTAVPIQQNGTQTKQVYDLASTTIPPNAVVKQAASLTTGMDVQVTWNAADTLIVYIFSSSQYAAYSNHGTGSPNIANAQISQSGSLSFHVSGNDTYYLVILNPHNGFFSYGSATHADPGTAAYGGNGGLSSQPVQLFRAIGTATFQGTTTTMVTQTTSSFTLVPQQATSTQITTGSYQNTVNLLSQIGGSACPG
jgi:hypothetical protein